MIFMQKIKINAATPSAPVPPDELIDQWEQEYACLPYSPDFPCSTSHKYIAKKTADWGYQQALPERQELTELLTNLVQSLDDLITSSDGVAGLHLNGNIAHWESLLEGGRFEGWLLALYQARAWAERLVESQETLPTRENLNWDKLNDPDAFNKLPAKQLGPHNSVVRDPLEIEVYCGKAHVFFEDHTIEDIVRYAIKCGGIDDVEYMVREARAWVERLSGGGSDG